MSHRTRTNTHALRQTGVIQATALFWLCIMDRMGVFVLVVLQGSLPQIVCTHSYHHVDIAGPQPFISGVINMESDCDQCPCACLAEQHHFVPSCLADSWHSLSSAHVFVCVSCFSFRNPAAFMIQRLHKPEIWFSVFLAEQMKREECCGKMWKVKKWKQIPTGLVVEAEMTTKHFFVSQILLVWDWWLHLLGGATQLTWKCSCDILKIHYFFFLSFTWWVCHCEC